MSFLDQGLKLLGRYTEMDSFLNESTTLGMKCATRYIGKDLKDLNRASPISLIGLIEENFEIQNNACDKFKYDFSKQN